MWRATWKGLLAHRLRMVMTAVAVVLGVSFIAGTYVLTDTIGRVFDDLVGEASAGVDLQVRGAAAFTNVGGNGQADERPALPAGLVDEVARIEGVAAVAGSVEGYAQLVDGSGEAIAPVGPPTLGVSWTGPPLGPFDIREGRPPAGPDEVVVDAVTARRHDLAVGDRVTVLSVTGKRAFEVVGTAGFGEADNLAGATVSLFDLATAQEFLGSGGEVDSVLVAVAPSVTTEAVRGQVADLLPDDAEVLPAAVVAAETSAAIQQGLGFLRIGLLVFAAVALFVGSFLIANTFTIVVAQRTREFALLRALGATGGQVVRSVLAEAAVVGLVSSVAGIGAGIGLAVGLRRLLAAFGVDLPGGGLVVAPRTVVVSLAAGVAVTALASLLPARRAARVEPVAAMRDVAAPVRPSSRRRTVAGAALAVAGLALLAYALLGDPANGAALVGAAALSTFLGVGALAPLAVRPLAAAIGAPAARLSVAGRLARGNAVRSPRRTAATASALMIGLALVSFVSVFAASLKASADAAIDEQLEADLVLTASNAVTGQGFTPVVAERLRDRPGVEVVSVTRFGQVEVDGGLTFLQAIDPSTWDRVAGTRVVDGSVADLAAPGTVMVDADVARARDLSLGDTVPFVFAATGDRDLRVVAVYEPDAILNGGWVTSADTFAANFRDVLDASVLVEGSREAVEAVTAEFPNVVVRDQAEYATFVSDQVDRTLALVTALLLMAIVIAVFGIWNTLALSVFERTREIGLLRAVGMGRRQVRSMVRWEAVTIAVIGAVLGLAVGVVFGASIVTALASEGVTELAVPGGQLALYVVAAGVAGIVASIAPARRAARLDVLAAIATE